MITRLFVEFTRKDLLSAIDPNFIHHKQYTKDLKSKIGQASIDSKNWYFDKVEGEKLIFKIKSATENKLYNNIVILKDSYDWLIKNFNFDSYDLTSSKDKDKMVYELKYYFRGALDTDDLDLYCDCPAFLYWGYKYLATQLDYVDKDNKETRPAKKRNPTDRGSVCKHLNITLRAMSDNRIKPYIIEYLVDEFLDINKDRLPKEFRNPWWRGYFHYIKKLIK